MDATLISLISACTALAASIIGPIVTLVVAKRQFNATETLDIEVEADIETITSLAQAILKREWQRVKQAT